MDAAIAQAELQRRYALAVEALRLAKREKCRTDLYYLVTEVLFKSDILDYRAKCDTELYNEAYHRRLCVEVQDAARKKLFLKARNTFKTYVVTVGDTIRKLLINPDERILLINLKLDLSRKMLAHIRHLFGTEPLATLFPEYVPRTPEQLGTQDQYTVPCRTRFYKEPSILASSTGSRLTGRHFTGGKIDDPIDNDNCTTEEQIAQTKEWWERLQYLFDPGSWLDVCGTIYHFQDLYADPLQSRGDFKVFKEPIAYKDAAGVWVSRFPERWPWPRLQQMMESEDSVEQWNFWHQMMLEARNIGDTKFDPTWFITIQHDRVPPNLGRIITIDSAWKGEETRGKGDYTAIQVFGYDNLGHIYRQDCVYSNSLDILQGVERICGLMAKWRISTVVIERIGQDTFERHMKEECRRRGLGLRLVMPTRAGRGQNKEKDRILALQPYVKLGQFLLVDDCPFNKEFVSQATCFPNTIHDDLLDGAADVLLDEVKVMPQAHYRDDAWQPPLRPASSEGEARQQAYLSQRAMQPGSATATLRPRWEPTSAAPDSRWHIAIKET